MSTYEPAQRLTRLPYSAIRKLVPYAKQAQADGIEVIKLNIGDPDIKTPEVMLKVLHDWKLNPIRYAAATGEPELISALLDYYHNCGGGYLSEKNIIATIGGSEAIFMAFFALADPGDEIIVFEPFFANYLVQAELAGVKLVPVSTSLENGFHLPAAKEIEARITKRTRAIFFCSPNNPTGTVLTQSEITTLMDIAKKHGIYLMSDEVYREFNFTDRKHVSLLDFMEQNPKNVILLDSLSKRYSLCGARIGVLITLNEDILAGVTKIANSRLSGGLIDQLLAAKLAEVPKSYLQSVHKEYLARRDLIYAGLKKIPGVEVAQPEGAFYVMAGLPVKDAEDFCLWLLKDFRDHNQTLMLAPAPGFYLTPGRGINEVRIAYVLDQKLLQRALELLELALAQYPGHI